MPFPALVVLALAAADLPWSAPTPGARFDALEGRLNELERQSRITITAADRRIADLERVTPKEFDIVHYNVLADQAGSNMAPWFCYGAGLTDAERTALYSRFYEHGDKYKRSKDKGWPVWAEGILSSKRIAAVEAKDRHLFKWEARRERLWAAVESVKCGCRKRSPDLVTLSECDHFDDFWRYHFDMAGYATHWRKRPRDVSNDGCAIAWRRSTFELVASGGFDFGPNAQSTRLDRCCAFALLRWRRDPSVRLLVATAHLERDPQSSDRLITRGFQYGAIFRELLAFAGANDAEDVPVVLTGDLNAKDCDELAGIARTLVRLLSSPTHPLLWSIMDAPTGPTSVTEEREMRIDYVLYQSDRICLTGVGGGVAKADLHAPIPDETHPSDHTPVAARLLLKSKWAQTEDNARQWLACISGTTACRPLSGDALRLAYEYFDKDASGLIQPIQFEAGLQLLGFPGLDTSSIHERFLEAGCPLHQCGYKDTHSWAVDVDQFVQLYTHCIREGSSAMARQVEKAFSAFDLTGSGVMARAEMRSLLLRMASGKLDEARLDEKLDELVGYGEELADGMITLQTFSRWMMSTYKSFLIDPSLVQDSINKTPDFIYSQ